MRYIKILVALSAIFALTAVGASAASAASFEASKVPGNLKGKATTTQVFTVNGGKVECTTATTTGKVVESPAAAQKVTVNYSGCKAFGFVSVTISPAEYNLHAAGTVDILNTITINVAGSCTVTVGPQSGLKTVSYENKSGKILEKSAVTGIKYTSSGGFCGTSGTNGTYTGNNEVEEEGGTLKFVP